MLFYIFLVLGTWEGVLGKDDICDRNIHEVCPVPEDFGFPATRADVDRICPQFIQNMDCMDDHSRKCSPGEISREKFRQDVRALTVEACRNDSQLHSRIVEHIGCLHETFRNDHRACLEYARDKRDVIYKRITTILAENGYEEDVYDEELYTAYGCLMHSLEPVCFAAKSSARCGPETRDLVIELVGRTGFYEHYCAPANEERLAEFITLLELELEEETTFNGISGKQ